MNDIDFDLLTLAMDRLDAANLAVIAAQAEVAAADAEVDRIMNVVK